MNGDKYDESEMRSKIVSICEIQGEIDAAMARTKSREKMRCQSGFLTMDVESLLHAMRVSRYTIPTQPQQKRGSTTIGVQYCRDMIASWRALILCDWHVKESY